MQPDLQVCASVDSRLSGKEIPDWVRAATKLGSQCSIGSIVTQAEYFQIDWHVYLGLGRYEHPDNHPPTEKPNVGEETRELKYD